MLNTLRRNVQNLTTLVSKVLEENLNVQTVLGLKLERRAFDLWPLVEALKNDLQPLADATSTRLIDTVPDDLVVYADASLLRRVFQNLIANAIRYTPHGEVVIGARENRADSLIECWVADNGAVAVILRTGMTFPTARLWRISMASPSKPATIWSTAWLGGLMAGSMAGMASRTLRWSGGRAQATRSASN